MKKILPVLLLLGVFGSCRKPQDTPPLQSILTDGVWRISLYKQNNNNYTYLYSGWQFRFNNDKTVNVSNGTQTFAGTWNEDPRADNFTINITSTEQELSEISHLWFNKLLTYKQVLFHNDRANPTKELQFTKL